MKESVVRKNSIDIQKRWEFILELEKKKQSEINLQNRCNF